MKHWIVTVEYISENGLKRHSRKIDEIEEVTALLKAMQQRGQVMSIHFLPVEPTP